MSNTLISYSQLQQNLPKIVEEIKRVRDSSKQMVLVGIPRGGLYLTQDLSYAFSANHIVLAEDFIDLNNEMGLSSELEFERYQIFVCDDIYDTGKRYKEFERVWKYPQNRMIVQIARYKDSLPNNVIYGDSVEHNEYVKFPWEL